MVLVLMLMLMVGRAALGISREIVFIYFIFAGVRPKSKKESKKDFAGAGERPAASSHLVETGMCPALFSLSLI